ncbi:MAG: transcription elongation factor GreA [Cellulomonadaceae bacterium]|nr:transcription elongation factor GreA [Cellulomonadaceae bacterium]
MSDNVVWLTQEAYDRLQEEVAELQGPVREAIVARIAAARDEGDLKENGGYHAAREEQAKNEGRIAELQTKLRNAQVGTPKDDGVVEAGMVVTISCPGLPNEILVASREMMDVLGDTDLMVISPATPLGAALYQHSVGETVTYTAPNGKSFSVVIKDAKPFVG